MLEIMQTINRVAHAAVEDDLHHLNERELMRRADDLLFQLPIVGGAQPTAALLLRRYHGALQRELCERHEPRPLPAMIEDEVRDLTRAVMVAIGGHEGMSVEIAMLLGLAIRAQGVQHLCASPSAAAV